MRTPPVESSGILLRGRFAAAEWFILSAESPHPMERCPALSWRGRPYNLWLSDEILIPALRRRGGADPSGRDWAEETARAFAETSARARAAFDGLLPAAAGSGEPAVLAAFGMTANLQRTLAIVAEFLLDGRSSGRFSARRLSRRWCGIVDYPDHAPYFPSRVKRPAKPGAFRPLRRDMRHLCEALWCSSQTIAARCAEAIDRLHGEVRRRGTLSGE